MAKMRIYEIAKSLNIKSTDLVKALNNNGFGVKSPQSNIEDEAIAFVLKNFKPKKMEEDSIFLNEKADKLEKVAENSKKKEIKVDIKDDNNTLKAADKAAINEEAHQELKVTKEKISPKKVNPKQQDDQMKPKEEKPNSKEASEKQPGNEETYDKDALKKQEIPLEKKQKPEPSVLNRKEPAKETVQNEAEKTEKVVTIIENKSLNNNKDQTMQSGVDKKQETQKEEKRIDSKVENREDNRREQSDRKPNQGQNRNNNGQSRGQNKDFRNNGQGREKNDNRQGQNGNREGGRYGQNRNSNGDRPYQRRENGDRPNNGDRSYSRNNNGDRPYQRRENGDRPNNGDRSYSRNNNGDRPYQRRENGDRPFNRNNNGGQRNEGGRPYGNRDNGGRLGGNDRRGGKPGDSLDKMIAKAEETQKPNRAQNKGKRQNDSRFDKKKNFDNDPMELMKNGKNGKNGKRNSKKGIPETPKKDPNRKGAFQKPKAVEPVVEEEIKQITIPEVLTIKELADKMKINASVIVKKLFLAGKMVSINSEITFEEAEEIALEYDIIAEQEVKVDVIEELLKEEEEDESLMSKRPPVVCVMGHVDHGKTSLLDAIRHTAVTEREAGGITQHIGAYVVDRGGETITFLDTPGHEAFTSMRMRGAQSTDIAILVVAADDGVMPQTVEAISHAKAAGVEIIVAVNKIDKPSANIERVKQELVEHELVAEDWGGNTVFVPVSAHTKEGIPELLEMISLTAEVLELKANADRLARGIVIEAQLDKGRGPVATVLVQKGTLHVGDPIAIGSAYGKVRAMMDDKGRRVKEAAPSTPVEILGLNEVPDAGEIFMATENEKEARNIAEIYIKQSREKLLDDTKAKLSLDGLFSQIQAGNIKELNIIVKADVQGSVEAVKQSLLKLSNDEVAIRIIHGGVGAINESDVTLASASNAIIIGFNVRPDNTAKEMSEREKVDVKLYKVIYQAIEDIQAAMKGMLDPVFEEKVIGHVEVRQVFKASGLGTIAGSYVLDGKVVRGCSARITREGELIFEGKLASLKRFKDDVKEVASGYECGLVFEKFNDINELDQIELYVMEEVPR
ncbi:translation initiation factor IF-2 [[Clostridium] polysaccharolyticum]|uniref:Translation initiation factor IF-2 n=1 Tax=[Clostridium] polysaccharolyticum TaxID=29364 RepID=A0A1I0AIX6_9FIRM|nr:translation initiation factor IF-2 [[Clostridium] polysaccharolyticum]SES93796.1 translation initiation factor IF-2 [[Clostridium] polysaccharolyticum]